MGDSGQGKGGAFLTAHNSPVEFIATNTVSATSLDGLKGNLWINSWGTMALSHDGCVPPLGSMAISPWAMSCGEQWWGLKCGYLTGCWWSSVDNKMLGKVNVWPDPL